VRQVGQLPRIRSVYVADIISAQYLLSVKTLEHSGIYRVPPTVAINSLHFPEAVCIYVFS